MSRSFHAQAFQAGVAGVSSPDMEPKPAASSEEQRERESLRMQIWEACDDLAREQPDNDVSPEEMMDDDERGFEVTTDTPEGSLTVFYNPIHQHRRVSLDGNEPDMESWDIERLHRFLDSIRQKEQELMAANKEREALERS